MVRATPLILAAMLIACGSGAAALKAKVLDAARAGDAKAFEAAFSEVETRAREKNDAALKADVLRELGAHLDANFAPLAKEIERLADSDCATALQRLAGLTAVSNRTLKKGDERLAELARLAARVNHAASLADAAAGRWADAYQRHRKAMTGEKGDARQHEAHDALSKAIATWAAAKAPELKRAVESKDEPAVTRLADAIEGALDGFFKHEQFLTQGSTPCRVTLAVEAERALAGALAPFDAASVVLVVTGSPEALREARARCRVGDAYHFRTMTATPPSLTSERRARLAACVDIAVEQEDMGYGTLVASISLPKRLKLTLSSPTATVPWPREPWTTEVETPNQVTGIDRTGGGFTASASEETRKLATTLGQTLKDRLRDYIRGWPEWSIPNP